MKNLLNNSLMRTITFFLTLLYAAASMAGTDTVELESYIREVTVFFSGAQVQRTATADLRRGKQTFVFDHLPVELESRSLQVQGIPGGDILSVKKVLLPADFKTQRKEEKAWEDKTYSQQQVIREIGKQIEVLDLEKQILMDNRLFNKESTGSSIATIQEGIEFYRERLLALEREKLSLEKTLKEAKEALEEITKAYNAAAVKWNRPYSRVIVVIDARISGKETLNLTYYVPSAGWRPSYDFRVEDITKPLEITHNADVYQSSGEDWKQVKLTLSTGDPSLNATRPDLLPWYLGRYQPVQQTKVDPQGVSSFSGAVKDAASGEPIPFANVLIKMDARLVTGTATDFDGQFHIKPLAPGKYTVEISNIGFEKFVVKDLVIEPGKALYSDFPLQAQEFQLNEVVIAYEKPLLDDGLSTASNLNSLHGSVVTAESIVRGSRGRSTDYYIDGVRTTGTYPSSPQSPVQLSNSLKAGPVNQAYEIAVPFTIASDGRDNRIPIREQEIAVVYRYYAVPKLSSDVFLSAEMTDWEDLQLLRGKARIYFQGTFTGEGDLDVSQVSDTLVLSLGRDNSIIVQLQDNREKTGKRFLTGAVKETVAWDISIRNNRSAPIMITVEDQLPLSEFKTIEVSDQEYPGAVLDASSGKLTWDLTLQKGDKQVVSFGYSVKYPRSLP